MFPSCSTRLHGEPVEGFDLTDVTYHRALAHGTVRVAINRPEVRNAFRPRTVDELYLALDHARQSARRGLCPADRQRAVAQGRGVGIQFGW